jgi:hypothetical protein
MKLEVMPMPKQRVLEAEQREEAMEMSGLDLWKHEKPPRICPLRTLFVGVGYLSVVFINPTNINLDCEPIKHISTIKNILYSLSFSAPQYFLKFNLS